ncbi:hypothetical protein Tco_0153711 [Tanacetum coccineum]
MLMTMSHRSNQIWKISLLNDMLKEFKSVVCPSKQKQELLQPNAGLRASRKLKPELLRLVRGNGQREATGYVFVLNGGAVDSEECQSKAFSLLHFVELSILLPLMLLRKRNGFRKYSFLARDVPIIEKPINMYCDNTGAIAIANESGNH